MNVFYYVLIATILMLLFFIWLYRSIMKETTKEPTSGVINYDTDYPKRTQFDFNNLQDYPTEFPELIRETKKDEELDRFIEKKLSNQIKEILDRRKLRDKLDKIESEKNIK